MLTTGTKRHLLLVGIALLALWPSAQHLLAKRFELNPWKFFGWAMYCTAPPEPRVNIWSLDGTRELALPLLLGRVDGGFGALTKFTDLRRLWGRLYGPDELAQRILAGSPTLPGFRIYVNTVMLSARDGMSFHTSHVFECMRVGAASRCVSVR